MKINIKVQAGSSKNEISEYKEKDIELKVHVTAPAVDGLANKSIIKLLAKHYAVKQNQVNIISGSKNTIKLIEIL